MKRLGLIDYDLRKKLSSGQKSHITKLANEYRHALAYPKAFHIAKVSAARAKELKDSGFKVTKTGRAIIPLKGYEKASIKPGRIIFSHESYTDETVLGGAKDFYKNAMKLRGKKLKRNQYLTVRIGDNAEFSRKFISWADLINYVNNVFQPKDPGESKERILGFISVVTVHNGQHMERRKKNAKAQKGRKQNRND